MLKKLEILFLIIILIGIAGCSNEKNGVKNNLTETNNTYNDKDKANENGSYQSINLGDKISLDFVEMTIDSINIEDEIRIKTTRVPIIISKVDGNKYVTLRGKIKNLYTDEIIFSNNIYGVLNIDKKYNYRLNISTGYQVAPLEQANFVIYASVPNSVINELKKLEKKFIFTFEENFKDDLEIYNDYTKGKYKYEISFN